jgi:hypothetical protein
MKKLITILLLCILFSCNKDKINPEKIRLIRTERSTANGKFYVTSYEYDSYDHIKRVAISEDNASPVTMADIAYNGNEAILIPPQYYDGGSAINTVIRITLDADRKPLKRIEHWKAIHPTYPSYRYVYDTMAYQYNAEGLLTRASGTFVDSGTWNPNQIRVRRGVHTIDYTNTDRNITSLREIYNISYSLIEGSTIRDSSSSHEYTARYVYTSQYPNRMDFKNIAVLNEYKHYNYDAPFNRNYQNMPDSAIATGIDRDGSGAIVFNGSSIKTAIRSYNESGFLSQVASNMGAYEQTKFIYNK